MGTVARYRLGCWTGVNGGWTGRDGDKELKESRPLVSRSVVYSQPVGQPPGLGGWPL